MQGTIISEGIATSCNKKIPCISRVSGLFLKLPCMLHCTGTCHGQHESICSSLSSKSPFCHDEKHPDVLFYRRPEGCLGRFLLSLQSRPNLTLQWQAPAWTVILPSEHRAELPAHVGEPSWALLGVHILQVVFHPLEILYRTNETSGN